MIEVLAFSSQGVSGTHSPLCYIYGWTNKIIIFSTILPSEEGPEIDTMIEGGGWEGVYACCRHAIYLPGERERNTIIMCLLVFQY